MSYSLQMQGGDLATRGSLVGTVTGLDKLKQDLDLWVREAYRVDRFHPSYGSTLDAYIGTTISERAAFEIRSEVYRVLTNYQKVQLKRLREDPEKYSPAELLRDIVSVDVRLSFDTVFVNVVFTTVANRTAETQVGVSV